MFTRLIESERVRDRGVGAQAASAVVHAAIIGAAVYASLGMSAPRIAPIAIDPTMIWVPPTVKTPVHRGTPLVTPRCTDPGFFQLPTPPTIPTPQVDVPSTPTVDPVTTAGDPGPIGTPSGPTGSLGAGGDPDGVYEIVERPAAAYAGNPRPSYPGILRSSRIEGTVSARFIIDTTGRVEAASIAFESAGEKLFEESVRRALLASRFAPAETQGRRVRMLVRQDFAFRITP